MSTSLVLLKGRVDYGRSKWRLYGTCMNEKRPFIVCNWPNIRQYVINPLLELGYRVHIIVDTDDAPPTSMSLDSEVEVHWNQQSATSQWERVTRTLLRNPQYDLYVISRADVVWKQHIPYEMLTEENVLIPFLEKRSEGTDVFYAFLRPNRLRVLDLMKDFEGSSNRLVAQQSFVKRIDRPIALMTQGYFTAATSKRGDRQNPVYELHGGNAHDLKAFTLATFFSRGNPSDGGLNLQKEADDFIQLVGPHFDETVAYSPEMLRDSGLEWTVRDCDGMWSIGYFAWKPAILLLEMEKSNAGDIIWYNDCNLTKYPGYAKFKWKHARRRAQKMLNDCGFDVFIAEQCGSLNNNDYSNASTNQYHGNGWCPLLRCNVVIVRCSPQAKSFCRKWLDLCRKKELLIPDGTARKWTCPDQSIACALICAMKHTGEIPPHYPGYIQTDPLVKLSFIPSKIQIRILFVASLLITILVIGSVSAYTLRRRVSGGG